jgi:hypothetical protein
MMMTYDDLSPDDQALFDSTVRKLLREGLIWRELEDDRRAYNFLARRAGLIADHLKREGWSLVHHESLQTFQLIDARGERRRPMDRQTALWLLILRLMYAEGGSPVVAVKQVVARAAALAGSESGDPLPAERLSEALFTFQTLKLIRPADGPTLRPANHDSLIELLATLELAIPADAIERAHKQLSPPRRKGRKER